MTRRSVLVTGCSSGIGLTVAAGFVARGWQVVAGVRDARQVPAELAGAEVVPLDLTDEAAIARAAARIERLDCLVNNAGYALVGPFASYSADQMRAQLQVNFLGAALLTQALLPALRIARGRVLCISSAAGEAGLPMNSLYCASKFALEGWAESLAHELVEHGVGVALVEPGGHRTRFAANLRWGERSFADDSIEQGQLAGFRAMLARRLARPGAPPDAVAATVLRLAEAKRLPLRTRVGFDALALHWLMSLLPEGLALRLRRSAFRRMLSAPPPPALAKQLP